MANHIEIKDLKGIKYLNFKIPGQGVYVLTASNGSGKTTLINCLSRLQNTRAFNQSFIQHIAENVDYYENSTITYTSSKNTSVSYTYRKYSDSWRPTSKNSAALKEFGYTTVKVMPPLGNRVYIQHQTIRSGTLKAASENLRQAMSSILDNPKFMELRKIILGETRGKARRNNTAFLLVGENRRLRDGKSHKSYYSESSFSLGEIFTLNLLFEIENISNNSLLIIDELEVALHPKVQINLLSYLEQKSVEKNLTVIVSTHSSSLIKCAKNLIYLESDFGIVTPHYNCYPTMALREVAVEEDIQPDFIFFVEDDAAMLVLKEMIITYFRLNPTKYKPLWKILPIGGYPEVLRFIKNSNLYLLNRRIGQYAFLDGDVQQTKKDLKLKGNSRTTSENTLWQLFIELEKKTKYLSFTPEQGLWEWLNFSTAFAQSLINIRFPDSTVELKSLIKNCILNFPNPSSNPREEAKHKIAWICSTVSIQTNEDVKRIKQHLFSAFCENLYSSQNNKNELNKLFGPIFRHKHN